MYTIGATSGRVGLLRDGKLSRCSGCQAWGMTLQNEHSFPDAVQPYHRPPHKSDDPTPVPPPTHRVHLAVDSAAAVLRSEGAAVVLGPVTKAAANPLLMEDRPWEAANLNTYPSAALDPADGKVKLWYNTRTAW